MIRNTLDLETILKLRYGRVYIRAFKH